MSSRRVVGLLVSVVLAVVLVIVLLRFSKADLHSTFRQLRQVSMLAFAKLVVLNAVFIYISSTKWRMVESSFCCDSDRSISRTESFALTSWGMALGLILPVQFGMATARTLGTWLRGGAIVRGTGGTVIEQSFDLLVMLLFAGPSEFTILRKGDAAIWITGATLLTTAAILGAKSCLRLVRWVTGRLGDLFSADRPIGSLLRRTYSSESSVLNQHLVRRLILLSILRFAVLVCMSYQTSQAINAGIPLWHFAVVMPFVAFANVLAITPGGIGVNELTSTAALKLTGTPLTVAGEWAVANRVLVIASCATVAIGAGLLLAINIILRTSSHVARQTKTLEEI